MSSPSDFDARYLQKIDQFGRFGIRKLDDQFVEQTRKKSEFCVDKRAESRKPDIRCMPKILITYIGSNTVMLEDETKFMLEDGFHRNFLIIKN